MSATLWQHNYVCSILITTLQRVVKGGYFGQCGCTQCRMSNGQAVCYQIRGWFGGGQGSILDKVDVIFYRRQKWKNNGGEFKMN